MEKRLPLALFLSFLVLLGWQLMFAKPAPPPAVDPARAGSDTRLQEPGAPGAEPEAGPGEEVPSEPTIGALVGEPEERTLELSVGTPGDVGAFWAKFSNRGGRLVELRLADYYDSVDLSDEDKLQREHWVTLVESINTPTGASASLELRTSASSRAYERTPLEAALWSGRLLALGEGPRGWPGVEFELAQGTGLRFVKRVLFEPGTYRVHLERGLENTGLDEAERALSFVFTPAHVMPRESGDRFYVEPQAVSAGLSLNDFKRGAVPQFAVKLRDDKGKDREGGFNVPTEVTSFAGVQNKYFAMLLRAADDAALGTLSGATWRRVRDVDWAEENPGKADAAWRSIATDVLLDWRIPPRGETRTWNYIVYAGPKDPGGFGDDFEAHEVLIKKDLGFFATIAGVLLKVLGFFHGLVGNWGVSIILLTLSVRAILFPLSRRSQTSMARHAAKMKRIQPKIDELKKKYEKDPQKQRQAQAELMQKEGAYPPLGGCLPIFIQMPIFFGLYQSLRTSFDLRHAPFVGWIHDLSQPDQAMHIGLNTGLPIIGTIEYLNLLPPLMVVLWIGQQMTMPKPADEQAQKMQRMMMFMPLLMGVFLYNYAAGLSLYMITQSGLGIFEQQVIKKLWPVDDSEQERKKPSGFMAKMMERAQEAQREQEKRRRAGGGKPGKSGKPGKGGR